MGDWLAEEPVGLVEVARRLKRNKGTVMTMRARDQLPKERGLISERAPWWYWEADIVPWATALGWWPLPDEEA